MSVGFFNYIYTDNILKYEYQNRKLDITKSVVIKLKCLKLFLKMFKDHKIDQKLK